MPKEYASLYYLNSFHAILESIKAGPSNAVLYVTNNVRTHGPRIRQILDEAKKRNISIQFVSDTDLSALSAQHRGVILAQDDTLRPKVSIETLCSFAQRPSPSIVLVLDHIEDPQNLGAILRSADAFASMQS